MQKPQKSKTERARDAIAAKKAGAAPADITFSCGHTRHPNELRAVACSTCMDKSRAAKAQTFGARRVFKGRLPKGSSFAVRWDGEKWFGTLAVPGVGPFSGEGGALFAFLAKLDEMYRGATKGNEE